MNRLIEIQNELKAPKNQRNNFGGYNYRSCEDILEAVKPLLKKHGLALIISDEVCNIGERYYVRAVAQLLDGAKAHDNIIAETVAYAREEESKKGMDASQLTGSTSSYARKYALNGLFAIDDNKDSDATNTHGKDKEKTIKEKVQDIKDDAPILAGMAECKSEEECNNYWKENVSKLSNADARKQLATLKKMRIEALKEEK